MWEAVEGLTDLDGRIWQTFPRLALRPGRLTRDYLDGHRAAQVPPFRIFLVVLLLVFFTGGLDLQANHQNIKFATLDSPELQKQMSPSDRADLQKAVEMLRTEFSKPKPSASPGEKWLRAQLVTALSHQDAFKAALAQWAERFAILMLPIAALMLSVLFVFKKGVYVFDHLIFSMHSLSFRACCSVVFGLGWSLGPWLLCRRYTSRRTARDLQDQLVRNADPHVPAVHRLGWAFGFLIVGLLLVGLATVS